MKNIDLSCTIVDPILEPCYYCGSPANTVDHVVPRSLLADLAALSDEAVTAVLVHPGRTMTVPACRECNCLLGSQYFSTLAARKAWLKERLRRRYRRVLQMPDWAEEELEELRYNLRVAIEASLARRDTVRQRLRW
jgi:hypothetical protein